MKIQKKHIVIIALWAILVGCFTTAVLLRPRPNTIREPEVRINGDVGYEESPSVIPAVKLKATDGFIFQSDILTQSINIENNESNGYLIKAAIIMGDGSQLCSTDFIAPGFTCSQVSFTTILRRGTYKNSILLYKIYNFEEEFITQCEFPVQLTVI